MKGVNLLIVSGGGQLDDYWGGPWRHPYALFKWGLIAKAVGATYVFLSVGKCSLESRISSFFIRHALKFATYRSYRDRTSKRLLEDMVFTRSDSVYPDLAFSYVHHGLQRKLNRSHTGKVVGVSPIAYLSRYGWPKKNLSVYQRYLRTLVRFISDLVDRGYSIVLFSTDPVDRKVISEFLDRLAKDFNLDMNGSIRQPRTDTLDELFNQLVDVDYVVASRLHGVLLPQLLCIPVLAISYDQKVDTHMVDMQLPEYCLDIHNIEISSLIESFQSLAANADLIKARLNQRIEDNAYALKHQFDFVLGQKE
jgi:polysaccharide pyruvyl transferase WcaK-like protein